VKLPAYPKYKASGVEWLDEVPEHWEVKRLSYLAMLKSGENITSEMIAEGGDYPVYGGNGLRGNYHKFTHHGHYALIGRQGALCGNINYASGQFWASEHALVVLPLKEFATTWMGELLRAMNLGQYSITAAQPGIAAELIRGLRIPVPPLPEQHAIAKFLDRETGRIDRLVAKKWELIERLKEKRTALISRTVTRGLPPAAARAAGLPENPPLKSSGIPWIGEVPTHWKVLPFWLVTTRLDVGIAEAATHAYADDGVPLVRSTNIKFQTVDTNDLLFIDEEFTRRLQSKALRAGDIVTTRTGANLGVSAIIPESLHMAQCFTLLISTLRSNCDPRFYNAFINADPGKTFFAMTSLGAGQHNISVSILKEMPTVQPPLPEQAAIAAYLDAETAKLDALVAKVETAIERLQEYRTALITAAVTGKIDVRNSVARAEANQVCSDTV
jgi:type I restriction enzyme, S subunit